MGDWLVSAVIGAVSGLLSGAFGIGGGIITTPAISLVLGAPALIAVGTPLPVILPSAVTGAVSYGRHGLVDWRSGVAIGLTGSFTSVAGALLAGRVGGPVVLLGTVAIIFYLAIDTILHVYRSPVSAADSLAEERDATIAPASADEAATAQLVTAPAAAPSLGAARSIAIGMLTGLYSGFFGLGGGFVLVPLLTRWGRFPLKRAIATSLVSVAVLSVPGTITHALLGHIDWEMALALAIGVVPGAALGARITLGASERPLRLAFAALLTVVGVLLAIQQLRAV